MKTNKLNLLLLFLTLGVFAFSSCEDEFSEEDFLRLQAELSQENAIEQLMLEAELARGNDSARQALQQAILDYQKEGNAEALAQAGLLLSYTIRVENDGKPVPGATVSVSNSATGGKVMAAVSDASGNATLSEVPVGQNVVRFEAAGFYSMRGVVDFNPISEGTDYEVINGIVYPLGRNESSTLEVFANDPAGASVATMTGRVTLQSDATTAAPEFPAAMTIRAVLQAGQFNTSGVWIADIQFESDIVGSAVVDPATGLYSLTLPARQSGLIYDLIVPEVETTQRVAITMRDGVALATPEFADVLTTFGPNASAAGYSDAVYVPGATVEFPAPPAPGAGLKATAFTLQPRTLVTGLPTLDFTTGNEVNQNNTIFRVNSRGTYTAIPAVAVTGGGASTAATMTAIVNGYVTSINITNGGSGFTPSSPVTIQFSMRDAANANLGDIFTLTVNATAAGALPTGVVNVVASSPAGAGGGWDKDNPFEFAAGIASISGTPTTGTGAVITVAYTGYLTALEVTNGGANFTSIPTLGFTGGGTGAVQASVTIPAMQFTYEFGLDNSTNTTAYSVLPDNIAVLRGDSYTLNGGIQTSTTNFVTTVFEGGLNGGQDILDHVTISGGAVVPINPGTTFRIASFTTPSLVVTPSIARRAFALAEIGMDDNKGLLMDLFDVDSGEGYNAPFAATIVAPAGATGTGATVSLSGFTTNASGEVVWNEDYEITNRGSNYQTNLNAAFPYEDFDATDFSGQVNDVTVRTGDVTTNNIDLGTGTRASNVDGEDIGALEDHLDGGF